MPKRTSGKTRKTSFVAGLKKEQRAKAKDLRQRLVEVQRNLKALGVRRKIKTSKKK